MFERVREYLNNDFETYIRQWFPNAKRFGNNIYKTGDFNDTESKDGSLVFNLTEKYAKDFNTGETAGDIISIYAKRYCNGDNGKALKELINTYNLNYLFPNISQSNNNNKLSQKSSSLYNDNNKIEKLPNSKNNTNNHKKLSKAELNKDNKINNILEKIERYKKDDSVDKYLKSRNITKYSPDTYIVKTDKVDILVNISYKTEYIKETNTYKLTNKISGIQEIFLTKDGRKREDKLIPNKIQRTYSNQTMSGNPIRLSPKGENNGYIYITEGIENGLSLQEYINNEVWCALTITNLPTLPFEDNKIYVFVLDNDYKKDNITQANTEIINKLNELNIKYRLVDKITNKEIINNNIKEKITEEPKGIDNIYNNCNIIYSNGEYNFKTTIHKLKELNNKHLFYLIPNKDNQKGCDANDLLRRELKNNINKNKQNNNNKQYKTELEELLDQPLISIENKRIVKQNKRLKTKILWRPLKPYGIKENDNLNREFVEQHLLYDNMGLAERFYKRYANIYKKVDGIGICKYDGNGKYLPKQENSLYKDIQTTILSTYYEFDYITENEVFKSFRKLWEHKGIGEDKTINSVRNYILNDNRLDTDINLFDNENDNIINLANGYYDLDKGKLFPHTPDKLFFKRIDINYKEENKIEEINNNTKEKGNNNQNNITNNNINYNNNDWMKFLLSSFCDKVNGDYRNDTKGMKNLREFQKAVGYTFSTSTREEKIFILQGRTRSGKSTAMDTINEIMKDYCGDKQDEEYITSKDQNSNYLLSVRAQQKGTRYMQISEISKKNKLNGATIKRLAGDRLISAKFMHQNSFTYTQQTKYWITTNNIDFNEFDESISTKLFIIDFNKRCYEAGTEEAIKTGRVIDKDLKERLLLPYNKEFILKWIIEGYELYLREGLTLTEDMRETIEQLEQENDSIGMFIKDNMSEYDESKEYISGQKADTKVIYEKYKQYEMDNYNTPEEMVITFRRFIKNMRNRGFEIKRQYVNYDKSRNLFIINWRLNSEQTKEY